MTARRTLPGTALCSLCLALVASGCSSTKTVVPGRTLALAAVRYPEYQRSGVVRAPGAEVPTVLFGRALLRELEREGFYRVVDARAPGARPSDPGSEAAKAEAFLGVRLLGCVARPTTETERRADGASTREVTVYFFRGECVAEVTAYDSAGRTIAMLQRTGRWDSPRQDRPDGEAMQTQALASAIDDAARTLAREIRPSADAKR